MDYLFLAFANDAQRPLDTLREEDDRIMQTLAPRQQQGHYLIHRESAATPEAIARYLPAYRDQLVLFHYGGHADQTGLHLDSEAARAAGLAELLGQCPRLQLVFLNGCSTQGQVEYLLACGVPAVIATAAPIGDAVASRFAIQFYERLTAGDTLNAAFDAALAATRLAAHTTVVRAGRQALPAAAADTPLWALVGEPDRLDWRLPSGAGRRSTQDFVPNTLLLDRLMEAFAPHLPRVQQLLADEQLLGKVSQVKRRRIVLEVLPYPISEHVRKLLVPHTDGSGPFYDQLGPDRLRQMVAVYVVLLELLTYIMLAQLWDALGEDHNSRLSESELETTRNFLFSTPEERAVYDYVPLIRTIRRFFDRVGVEYFVGELSTLSQLVADDQPFARAVAFFQSIRHQLARQQMGEAPTYDLGILAEQHLAELLAQLGFLVRYEFTSVKNINVLKYRHLAQARFAHRIVQLQQSLGGLEEDLDLQAVPMDSASVLLVRKEADSPAYLNLTPFVIDENAFDAKASIAKLRFFAHYLPARDAYAYRHLFKPDDPPLLVERQPIFSMLKAQYDAFAQLLFATKMQDAG